jgi:hypothetical protein
MYKMNDLDKARFQRWERIHSKGIVRYAVTHGLAFGIVFFSLVWLFNPLPVKWYILLPAFLVVGVVWGGFMWIFTMWLYQRRKQSNI